MSKKIKELISNELDARFSNFSEAVLVDFSPLNAEENRSFRAHLRKNGVGMRVVKNSLLSRVLERRGIGLPASAFAGHTGVIHGGTDAITASKAVAEWGRKSGKRLRFKAGLLEGKPLDAAGTESLTRLPSGQEVRAMAVSAIAAPLTCTVGVLASVLSAMPRLLQAIADKKQ